jgi:hypothetical protein
MSDANAVGQAPQVCACMGLETTLVFFSVPDMVYNLRL